MIAAFAIVAIWAVAEGLLFFIVADVPISFVAVRYGWRRGLLAALIAALAATLGGIAAMHWGGIDPAGFRRVLIVLPAIDGAMIDQVKQDWAQGGYRAMLAGSFSGVPYKIFAAAAGQHPQGGLLAFIAGSLAARLPRFALVAVSVAVISRLFGRSLSLRARAVALGLFWIVFYGWYFSTMPG